MICPFCNANDDRVIDSRASDGGNVVRRRRQCNVCEKRFTTYERVEETARLVVVKRAGAHVPFDREKILRSVQIACGKRPIPEGAKAALVDAVEEECHREFDREIASSVIAQKVMQRLQRLDRVAFVRYASEHFQFDVSEIKKQLDELEQMPRDVKDQQPLFDDQAPAR